MQIAAIDHGPGIADVPAALRDGFSTGRSLGAGLGTCRRLSDDFALHSVPGRGTVAVARVSTTPRGGEVPVRPADGVFAGGQWPGGEPPFGAVACGGLTGHPTVSGEAPGFAGQTQGTTGGPAPAVGRAQGPGRGRTKHRARPSRAPARRPSGGTGSRPRRTGPPVRQAPAHGVADAGTPGTDSASRTAPSHGLADAGADPIGRTAPVGGSADSASGPRHRSLPVAGVRAGGVNIPYGGAEYSGDAWAWVRAGDRVTLMLADGLGHGPEAARASSAAVAALHRWAHLSPPSRWGACTTP